MYQGYKRVREWAKTCPLLLLTLKDKKLIEYAESLLPYSAGFEIECSKGENFSDNDFRKIPDIMEVKTDSYEQRFRIPKGIKGMICLWNICEQLKISSLLNMKSGIHYHTDFNDVDFQEVILNIRKNKAWILKALESWGYTGTYNRWDVTTGKQAVRFHQSYNTMEVRIGEMTFEYPLMIERIMHCQNISKRIKASLTSSEERKLPTKVAKPKRSRLRKNSKPKVKKGNLNFNEHAAKMLADLDRNREERRQQLDRLLFVEPTMSMESYDYQTLYRQRSYRYV